MKHTCVFMFVFFILAAAAGADVIYQEDFGGSSEELLNGRAPAIAPEGVTWVAGEDFKANGDIVWSGTNGGSTAYLPFEPQSGRVYVLSTTINITEGSSSWGALGFTRTQEDPDSRFFSDADADPVYWMISRHPDAGTDNSFVGPDTAGADTSTTISANNLKIILDTTSPTWVVKWIFNDTYTREVNVDENLKSYFNYVILGTTNDTNGSISSFSLEETIYTPWNPSPADGAKKTDTEVAFSWNQADDPNIIEHSLRYIAYDLDNLPSNPSVEDPGATEIVVSDTTDPVQYPASGTVTFPMDSLVLWRVEHILSGGGDIAGNEWEFEIVSYPVITQHPEDATGSPGDTVEFSVQVESYTPAHYKWYKSEDQANDTPADDVEVGNDAATLTLENIQEDKIGYYYYCEVSNSSGTTVVSEAAYLIPPDEVGLVAWYKFEDNLINSVDGSDDAGDWGTASYVSNGVAGKAYSKEADGAIAIPRYIQDSFTIEFWIKTTETAGTGTYWHDGLGLVDGWDGGTAGDDFGTTLLGDNFAFGVGGDPSTTITSTSSINDGEWHYCVATRDHNTGQMRVFVDGSMEASAIGPAGPKTDPSGLRIGKTLAWENYLAGQFDEVKLYTRAISEFEVAQKYHEITGEQVCIGSEQPKSDINGDCVVDFIDFAIFAESWLYDGTYPPVE